MAYCMEETNHVCIYQLLCLQISILSQPVSRKAAIGWRHVVERLFWQAICQTILSYCNIFPESNPITREGVMPWCAARRWQKARHA